VRPIPDIPPTDGEAGSEARAALDHGRRLFSEDRAAEALVHIKRAVDLHPSPAWLRYRAQVLAETGEHCEAFDDLLLAHDLSPQGAERERIMGLLAEESALCAPGMGWAIVRIRPEKRAGGTRIEVSGTTVPAGRAIGLRAGTHQAVAACAGTGEHRVSVEVELGRGETHWITLPEPVAAPAPVETEQPALPELAGEAPSGDRDTPVEGSGGEAPEVEHEALIPAPVATESDRTIGTVLLVGGAVLCAAGTWSYVDFLSRRSDLDDLRGDYTRGDDYLSDYESARDAAVLRRDLGIGLWTGSAAIMSFGAVLLLMGPDEASEPTSFGVLPVLRPGFTGLELRGALR